MSLATGTRLGPYEVLGSIGAGGMGEVYRARDTRLAREVALKTLPADVAGDPERRGRFEREARAVAALSHPGLLALYDVGEASGVAFMITELLEGETLRERLLRGPIPCERAAEWGAAAADALAVAHERAIAHRDLKPENLFLTRDGRLKILDFGLAKELVVAAVEHEAETLRSPTRTGVVLGTLGYLSPEQARGEVVDARTDIFSLGCVLYEGLTGRRAFEGKTAQDLIAAVLRDEPPPVASLRPDASEALVRVVERCLAKQKSQRFQSASDLAFALRASTQRGSGAPVGRAVPGAARPPRQSWLAPAALGLVGLAAGYALHRPPEAHDPIVVALTGGASREASPAISPDGKFVAYLASDKGRTDLWVKFVGGGPGVNLTAGSGLEVQSNATVGGPEISPDGSAIAVSAGPPGAPNSERGTWLVPAPLGGPPRLLVRRAGGLRWSPDGQRIAFMRPDPASGDAILVARADGGDERLLVPAAPGIHAHEPAWSADGAYVYFDRGPMNNNQAPTEIWRVPSKGGEAERAVVTQGIAQSPLPTPDGRALIYAGDQAGGALNLWWRPLGGGSERRLTRGAGDYLAPRISRDGRRLVCEARTGAGSIRVLDLRQPTRPGLEPASGGVADVSPSIARTGALAFVSARNGTPDIWVSDADGSNPRPLTSDPESDSLPAISPDGSRVAFVSTRGGSRGLWLVATSGGPPARLVTVEILDRASWSADGRRLLYAAEGANHQPGLWIIPAEGGTPTQVPGVTGRCPAWSPASDEIAYFTSTPTSGAQTVRLTTSRGEPLSEIVDKSIGAVDALAFSWDGRQLAIGRSPGTANGQILIGDFQKRTSRAVIGLGPFAGLRGVAWTPDDSRLVYGLVKHESRILLFEGLEPER